MTSNPHTPVGGPRLVTKLCVVGEAGEEDGSGASFLLFMRANLPHQTQDQSYPLFPDDHVQLRSSHLAPLTPSGTLATSGQPSALILEAAKRLRIPTSTSVSSSASSSGRPPSVQIAVQDFAVSLLAEGTRVASTGSHPSASQQRLASSSGGSHSRRNSFSPVLGGDQESTMWIVVLEVAVPCATLPPLDCYSISLPLPRCLSNTLRFHLNPSPSSDDGYFNIATTPRLLSSPEVPSEELALEGTFQSTATLEIRWAKSSETSMADASPSTSVAGGKSKMVTVRKASPLIAYTAVLPAESSKESPALATEVEIELSSAAEVHYPGVESSVHLDVRLDLPASQPFEWLDLPYATTNVGLISFELLDSVPPVADMDPDTSTASTIQSPPSPSPSTKTPAYLSDSHPNPSPGSTSQLSLLRQRLPSLLSDTSDLSFAMDPSGSPSPRTSPSIQNRSPLSRANAASSTNHQNTRRVRLHLDLSKIHQHSHTEPFSFSIRGTVRLGRQQDQPNELVLPMWVVQQTEPETMYVVSVDATAVAQVETVAPRSAERISSTDASSKSSGPADRWDLRLRGEGNGSDHFKLVQPPPSPALIPASSSSQNFRTIKARRQSTSSTLFPVAQNLFSGSASGDLQSRGWAAFGSQAGGGSSREEALSKVDVEIVLVPRSIDQAAESPNAKGKGKVKAKGDPPPVAWDQLTKMRLLVPPRSRPDLADGREGADLEDEEDTLEFGIIATGSTVPLPTLRILSASVEGRPLAFEMSDPDVGDKSEEAPGAIGYVKLLGEEGMRERGGEVEVCFLVEDQVGSSIKDKRKGDEVILGLPSFEGVVGWEEVNVSVSPDYSFTSTLHSAAIRSSSATSRDPSPSSSLRTLTHSLPPLHAPHLHLLVRPTSSQTLAHPRRKPSFFSASNLPLVILSILIFSMGTEIRTLRSGLVDMVVAAQTEALATREAITRCDAVVRAVNARAAFPAPPPLATTTTTDSVLRPTFTEIFPPPPAPPPVYQRPGDGEVSPFRVVRGLNQLHQWAGKVDEALERNVFGRGAKRLGGVVSRVWGWVVWG